MSVGASATSDVSISVADDKERVVAGQMVRYQVIVRNTGVVEAPVEVKLTVSPQTMGALQAENATAIANAVAWKNSVGAGETTTFSLAGRVEREVSGRDIAVTACVHLKADAPAVACATDGDAVAVAPTPHGGASTWVWIGSILFGLLAVAGAVWLHKKINPVPLAEDPEAQPQRHNPVEPHPSDRTKPHRGFVAGGASSPSQPHHTRKNLMNGP
jgi:hypothetical protein